MTWENPNSSHDLELRPVPTHLRDFHYNLIDYNMNKVVYSPINIYLRFIKYKEPVTSRSFYLLKNMANTYPSEEI